MNVLCFVIPVSKFSKGHSLFFSKNCHTTGEGGARVNFILGVISEIRELRIAHDGRGVRVNFVFEVSKFEGARSYFLKELADDLVHRLLKKLCNSCDLIFKLLSRFISRNIAHCHCFFAVCSIVSFRCKPFY